MSKLAGITDLVDFIQGKAVNVETIEKATPEYKPWAQILAEEIPDTSKRARIDNLLVKAGVYKDVTSVDLGPVRISSLYPIIAQIVNLEFKLLRMLNARTPLRVTDYQTRIPEETIGTDIIPFFNLDANLPPVYQSILSERTNTLGAVGQQIQVSFMASELAAQSPYRRDELANQIAKAMTRINRSLNLYLWNNVEQTGEQVGQVPQFGGFFQRSNTNVQATGGSNLTDAFIANAINQMAAVFGYDGLEDVVGFTNNTQISVIRSLMINRYPGNNPMAKMEYDQELKDRVTAMGLPTVQMIYEDSNALVIPFIRDMQMPANSTLLFKGMLPVLGKFQLQGSFGPFVIERPITNLYKLDVAFDICTLVDPLQVSRASITGHP